MRSRSLFAQVLAVNLLLAAGTVLVATIALDAHGRQMLHGREVPVLAGALVATLLGNWLLLHRRFEPLGDLVSTMEAVDLSHPATQDIALTRVDSAEVERLEGAFHRMVARLETERRLAGRAAIAAQERERRRLAQDLHDEVNQALTAVTLRLQASIEQAPPELRRELIETKRLSSEAMAELLALARQLRPAVLDDHGLVPALRSHVRDFGEQAGIDATFTTTGTDGTLSPEQQLVVYRVTQESLSNVVQHAGATRVTVELALGSPTVLRITDDGRGIDAWQVDGSGLGLSGMRERAMLVGGTLSVGPAAGRGTAVELRLP